MNTTAPYDLERFVSAQQHVYPSVIAELRAGRKTSHWMWFVFPQLEQLGHSAMAKRYGIAGREEALAYLQHALLGARLEECAQLVLAVPLRSAYDIFGSPDDLKLRSCMTLFDGVSEEEENTYRHVLQRYYDGVPDPQTLRLLG